MVQVYGQDGESYVHNIEAIVIFLRKLLHHIREHELGSRGWGFRKLGRRYIEPDQLQRRGVPCRSEFRRNISQPDPRAGLA